MEYAGVARGVRPNGARLQSPKPISHKGQYVHIAEHKRQRDTVLADGSAAFVGKRGRRKSDWLLSFLSIGILRSRMDETDN